MSANTLIFRGLLLVVALAPLPLGGNRPWAWSLLAVLTGLLGAAWTMLTLNGQCTAPLPLRRLLPAAIPFGCALVWAVVQTMSFVPHGWWHPLWSEAAAALGSPDVGGMISVAPESTLNAVMRLSCYAVVYVLAAQLSVERARAHEALLIMVLSGVAYASYGLLVYFSGTEEILWLKKWAYLGDLTATFVNRNAYGAYAGLGLVCCVAMFAQRLRQRRQERRGASEWTETLLVRAMPYLAAALITGTALLLSHSRGAFLVSSVAIIVLMIALTFGRVVSPPVARWIAIGLVLVGTIAITFNGEKTLDRLLETGNSAGDEGRGEVFRLTFDAITDAPLTGHGLGAFQSAFRMYRDGSLPEKEDWQYAHNVFLETTMDLGIPGALAMFGSLAVILGSCARGLVRRRRDQVYPATALAAAVLLAAHGLIDFSAQMPAIAMTLALLLGVGFAQSWSSRQPQDGSGGV